jgi:L-alanine-DL-glutamate epimerase-like enolase superfamily enzyme
MSNIESVHCKEIIRPLRTTFSTSLGQKDVMKSIIVKVHLKNSSMGLGECPTSFVLKEETIPAIKGIMREVAPELKGLPINTYSEAIEKFRKLYPRNPMTVSGLETALFRASLCDKGFSEYDYFGGKLKTIETDITIPYLTDFNVLNKWMNNTFKKKFTIYKLKVSGNTNEDKRLISAVYGFLKNHVNAFTIRLDGNQGFTKKTCLDFLDFLTKSNYPIELFEQPLPKNDYKGLREIKKRSPVPIILDETIFNEVDLERAVEDDLCHGINIKIAKSGISESLKLYNRAKKYSLKLMMGCMTETMVGLSAGINFAAGTGGFNYIDLDAIHFLHHKNSYEGIAISCAKYLIDRKQKEVTG